MVLNAARSSFDAAMSDCSSSDCCREDATFLNASSMNGSPDAGRELGAARIAASAGYRNIRRETLWLRVPDLPPEGGRILERISQTLPRMRARTSGSE